MIYLVLILFLCAMALFIMYLRWIRTIRNSTSPHLMNIYPEAKPFFLESSKTDAVLLIHGFTSTPRELLPLGTHLHARGFTVRGMALPGHGTHPKEMELVDQQDWYHAVSEEYEKLCRRFSSVYVAGFSLGGLLAIKLALDKKPAGIALIAPFLQLSPHYFRIKKPERIIRLAEKMVPFVKKSETFVNINDPDERKKHICYKEISTQASVAMFDLAEEIMPRLNEITIPALLIHTKDDKAVDPAGTLALYSAISSDMKQLFWVSNSNHVIPLDYDKERVNHAIAEFFITCSRLNCTEPLFTKNR